jgi:hypothetical protein
MKRPFKKDDSLVEPTSGDSSTPPISQEILDIYNKLDWSDKRKIPIEEYQKAFYKQKQRNKREEKKEKHMKYYGDFDPGNYPA